MTHTFALLVLDDHALFRDALQRYLSERGTFRDVVTVPPIASALDAIPALGDVVVLLDVSLDGESGLTGVARLRESGTGRVRVLALTMHTRASLVQSAMDAGVDGFVTKDSAGTLLLEAIDAVCRGKRFVDPMVEEGLADRIRVAGTESPTERYRRLSPREQEVFALLARGYKPRDIARELHISPKTADVHRYNILKKMRLSSIADLVRDAVDIGIV